ncbi:hypothetical protein NC652_000224 [Populus alba x Populus x berolinensis]|uniref:Uncharacterized protein n=1 Tax=Populus alba x Populus x berolinensis TaxID=444605 RepID=A0AAD6RJW1_9ROSI|nr:hypothetical protein NC652_000224 [Populus alba x Populus x berolinensis]KAJ7009492.1 hypothetical protein NC653_000243 [Populus alba x Populus x berolinensis]
MDQMSRMITPLSNGCRRVGISNRSWDLTQDC